MHALTISALATLSLFSFHPTADDDVRAVDVGSREVSGKRLRPFDATWTSAKAEITEVATIEKRDGRKCYVRVQHWPALQEGVVSVRSELVLDASTLETVSFQTELVGLPEGAGVGDTPVFLRWEFDGANYACTVQRGVAGERVTNRSALPAPMFEGSGLGLALAALPLKDGYEARLPVAMNLGLTDALTLYNVHARVVGTETFEWKGKDVEAWVVDVDWADPETGEITSAGGADAPGGAYFVAAKPPKGCPHVVSYRNDSVRIELASEE